VVELIDCPQETNQWMALVHFLVDDAPHDLLTEGANFELYEGKRRGARGQVQSQAAMEPSSPSGLVRARSVPSPGTPGPH